MDASPVSCSGHPPLPSMPPLPSRYLHASSALPAHLVAEIQRHVYGRYVWIPSPLPGRRATRDLELLDAIEAGELVADAAERLGLSSRRIYQIIAASRRSSGSSSREGSR